MNSEFSELSCGIGSNHGHFIHVVINKEIPCLECKIAHTKYEWERTHQSEWQPNSTLRSKYGRFLEELGLISHG